MGKYFSIEVATQRDVVCAYRGNDEQNTLDEPVPPDDQSVACVPLSAGDGDDQLDDVVARKFAPMAFRNPRARILIRVGDDNVATAWIVNMAS